MAFCSKCGNQFEDGNVFCPKCGATVGQQPYQQSYQQTQPNIDTTGIMIWSVINLLFCWPLSVWSFITLNKVNKAATQAEAETLFKTSKTICAVASALGVLWIIIVLAAQ